MDKKIRIIVWNDISNDFEDFFRTNSLIPIIGSGFSAGVQTHNGGIVPSGLDYRKHMIEEIVKSGL